MLVMALALAAAAQHPGQTLAGPAFERFAARTDQFCPSRQLRTLTPGDLSWEQESFVDQLSPAQKARLAQADRNEPGCQSPGGLACPTTRTLDALWRTGMLDRFSRFACAHVAPGGAAEAGGPAAADTAAAIP